MEKSAFVLVLWMMLLLVGVSHAKTYEEEALPPNSHWVELRKLFNTAFTYLFPPKIDFRAGKPAEDGGVSVNENENVKEALTKSFEKTKQMVEDSAKAAAETLQQPPPPPHSEL